MKVAEISSSSNVVAIKRELRHLHKRLNAVDVLIAALEEYSRVSADAKQSERRRRPQAIARRGSR